MYFDPNFESIFEAFALFIQQQYVKEYKEDMTNKALYAVVDKFHQFEGKDIIKYLRCHVKEIELKRVPEREMFQLFELTIAPKIRNHVVSIIGHFGDL